MTIEKIDFKFFIRAFVINALIIAIISSVSVQIRFLIETDAKEDNFLYHIFTRLGFPIDNLLAKYFVTLFLALFIAFFVYLFAYLLLGRRIIYKFLFGNARLV